MLRETTKLSLGAREKFVLIIAMILITGVVILLDVPVLKEIFGFLCITIAPGMLIIIALNLNKIGITEKIVLSVGLSISFIMFFGLLINELYFSLGCATPLSTIPLVVSFSAAMILFCIFGYKTNKEAFSFAMPNFKLNTAEKAFLIVLILFPALSIFGMHVMNTSDNNVVLVFLLLLIPIYIAFVCFFNQKVPKRLYPVMIILISISLSLLISLRSNYLIGFDVHEEYHYFQTTFNNLHWDILGYTTLDACLSISILPSIYQSFLDVNGEYLFKLLYTLLLSVTPLIVFIVSKKYVGELYGFLASCFFMSQRIFFYTASNPRTNTATLFFALAIMVLLSDGIDAVKKKVLFIVFMLSIVVSHYSTAYISFFIILFSWFSIEIVSKRFVLKKNISLGIVLLFFVIIFFWYSLVTGTAFELGATFIEQRLFNLHNFFVLESRCERIESILGVAILHRKIPFKIEFAFTWLTFVLIGVGVISMIIKYKEMVSIPEIKHLKPDFLKTKFPIEYFVMVLACAGLLIIMIVLPSVSGGYDIQRLYSMVAVVLSVVFVLGGIMLSKHFFFLGKRKPVLKEKNNSFYGKVFHSNERLESKNNSQVGMYLIILLVLIPYFMCVTGTMYEIFDVPREMTLNSEGYQYHSLYIYDQGSNSAKWVAKYANRNIYTDWSGWARFRRYGFKPDVISLIAHKKINGYIYLSYYNVIDEKLLGSSMMYYNMTKYSDTFTEKCRIYDNGGSEVWR